MTRSFYKRGKGRILHIPAAMLGDGMDVEKVSIEAVQGGILIRPVSSVLVTISGKPCYTWEEAAWAVEAERAKEQEAMYAEDGDEAEVEEGTQNADHPENE